MSLMRILDEQAVEHQFERVRAVWLEVGKLSCVEPEALRFCFEVSKSGTVADGATLHIVEVPGRAWCHTCDVEFEVGSFLDPCPTCGAVGMPVDSGSDLRIKELEVD